jgi:anti-sigma regulatory factor (Ser/Thr protein kinase)
MTGRSTATGEVVVRFPTHPHSVRTARQLTADTLRAWDLEPLVEDARLVVTELATNATLHSGARSFLLSLAVTPTAGVRIAIGDEGPVPAAAVVRRSRPGGETATPRRPEATTGRGLTIVDELTAAWGVEVDRTTKWVWAVLSTDAPAAPDAGPPAVATPPVQAPLPPGWHVVRLVDCPVALSLAQDDHLDELVRELQLVGSSPGEPELASVIGGLLDGQAQARHMAGGPRRRRRRGRQHVTVEMVMPFPRSRAGRAAGRGRHRRGRPLRARAAAHPGQLTGGPAAARLDARRDQRPDPGRPAATVVRRRWRRLEGV